MCGIVGYLASSPPFGIEKTGQILSQMRDMLAHRGPDDSGSWQDSEGLVGLGHRRLSILDVTPDGHQPMHSRDSRYSLTYNGEVYNFLALRHQLEQSGHQFRGNSDTEVILEAFSRWGPEDSIHRFNGMFALALWDRQDRRLLLARDRHGKKPLYYGYQNGVWIFGSELKALWRWPNFDRTIDREALSDYLRYAYLPSPRSIYQSVSKLPAASWVWLQPGDPSAKIVRYWSPKNLVASHRNTSLDEIERALKEAVRLRMVSDVPLGAFLSGGIDSSLVVSLMQELSTRPIRTFCLGFTEKSHDEAPYARAIAQHLGTDHTEFYVSPGEALAVVPLLPTLYDEPFADPSQIPTFLVSKIARNSVTVALSGDGGDEVFGGYNRYLVAPPLWRLLRRVPLRVRRFLAYCLQHLSFRWARALSGDRFAYPEEKINKLSQLLDAPDRQSLFTRLLSNWQNPASLVKGLSPRPTPPSRLLSELPFAEAMMLEDMGNYLIDDVLVKVDRASMGVGLEARAPYLDPDVCALAWGLPGHLKFGKKVGKVALRKLLYQRVPSQLLERPKAGFSFPLGHWLRRELRPWAEDLLSMISHSNYLHAGPILTRWKEHLSGRRDWSASLWTVLMFQAWICRDQGSHPSFEKSA